MYTALATLDSLTNCRVTAISRDCQTAVGHCTVKSDGSYRAIKWVTSTGAASLLSATMSAQATGVNSDGSKFAGNAYDSNVLTNGVVWLPATGGTLTAAPIEQASLLSGLSGNGKIVVGYSAAFEGVFFDINNLPAVTPAAVVISASGTATNASDDGTVIVGNLEGQRQSTAVRWTADSGAVSLSHYTSCDELPACGMSSALAVSGDGNVTVGASYNFMGTHVPVRWVGTGAAQRLGAASTVDTIPRASSLDGNVIVGVAGRDAFIWDAESGTLQSLPGLLASIGVPLPTAPQLEAVDVCGNGNVIVGNSLDPNNTASAWTPWAVDLSNTGLLD